MVKYLFVLLILISSWNVQGQHKHELECETISLTNLKKFKTSHRQYNRIRKPAKSELLTYLNKQHFQIMFREGLACSAHLLKKIIEEKEWNRDSLQSHFFRVYDTLIESEIEDNHKPSFSSGWGGFKENRHTLKKFSGKWFGKWRNDEVNHLWLRPVKTNKTFRIGTEEAYLRAYQSAFIGDGIGLNYLIEWDGEFYLLGMTYHYQEGEIIMKRPHIGLSQSENTIVWLTKDHIYFEYLCNCNKIGLPEHYVIDGVYFHKDHEEVKSAEGFRAIYFREKRFRSSFKSFQIDKSRMVFLDQFY